MKDVDGILKALRGAYGRITVFCGAGISVRSGLPTASVLLKDILASLGIDRADMDSLRADGGNWCMPFEAFMDAFIEHEQGSTRLFDIFLLGQPNRNHFLIKQLAIQGIIQEVCTTNFDVLLERMLDADPQVSFALRLEGDGDVDISTGRKRLSLVKLHGTADRTETIRSTIRSISAGEGFNVRQRLIWRVFGSPSSILLVWGYSCSDVLDINPIILEIDPKHNQKLVVLVQHDPSITSLDRATIAPLTDSPPNHPFHRFRGASIRIDADVLLGEVLGKGVSCPEEPIEPNDWQQIVRQWIASFAFDHIRSVILCHLFYKTGKHALALKYNDRAIQENRDKDERGIGAALSNRGMILHKMGRHDEALRAFHAALTVFEGIDYAFGVATSLNNIGYVSGLAESLEEGRRFLQKGFEYLDARCFKEARVCRGYLAKSQGELHMLAGDISAAEESYDLALDMFRGGYVAEEADVLMLKGKMCDAAERPETSRRFLRQAKDLAAKIGYSEVVEECSRLLGEAPP